MCPNCRAFISTKDKVCPYCGVKLGPRAVDRRNPSDVLGGLIPAARFTTVMIMMINFGLYLVTAVFSMRAGNPNAFMGIDVRTLLLFGAKNGYLVLGQGEWWRLITAGFLHAGLIHILMNSWVLYDLGVSTEHFFGTWRMLVIYFTSSVVGFLASTFWNPGTSIGASAALFGLIGAMIALGVTEKSSLGSSIKSMYIRWAIYGLIFSFVLPMIDIAAHLGGLVTGFVVGYLAGTPRLVPTWKDTFWRWAAYGCILLTVMAFLRMFIGFKAMTG